MGNLSVRAAALLTGLLMAQPIAAQERCVPMEVAAGWKAEFGYKTVNMATRENGHFERWENDAGEWVLVFFMAREVGAGRVMLACSVATGEGWK